MNVLLCYQQIAVLSRYIQRRKGLSPAAFLLCSRVVLLWPPFFYGGIPLLSVFFRGRDKRMYIGKVLVKWLVKLC